MHLRFSSLLLGTIFLIQSCAPSQSIEEVAYVTPIDTVEIMAEPDIPIYQASESRINDLLHTKLEVSFNWDSSYLYGKAWLKFKPHFYPVDSLILDAKGQRIEEVALLDSFGKTFPLAYQYDTMQLKIALDRSYERTDTFNIYIEYTAMPDEFEAGGSAAITNEKGLYFINPKGEDPDKPRQIWTQGETESSSRWFPTIDAPNEKTTQEIYITVDTLYETLSNGKLLFQTENGDGTRTDYWKQELPHAPYLFMMAIGDFAIVKDEWREMPVHYYVEHEYQPYAKDIYRNTVEMIDFFSEKLGYDYPWDKYHQVVVRDYVSGAMENTGAVIYGEFVQGDDRYLIDNSREDVVAHELIHHWFGDLVTTESWANLPLNESFATYGEYLWNEYKYGKDEADYKLNNDLKAYLNEARIKREELIRYDYENEMEMFDTHSYQKGGRVLHMLRKELGDEAFFESLTLYLKENEFNPVEIHQLRLAFEEVSGRDLQWFFNQWFLRAGHPELTVTHQYVDSTKLLTLQLEQGQEGENIPEAFILPIELEIVRADGAVMIEHIKMEKRKQDFDFEFEEAPLLVNVDADKVLLATIDQDFDSEAAIQLFLKGGNYMDRLLALKSLKLASDSAALEIFAKAMDDPAWHIRQTAIQYGKNLASRRGEFTKDKLIYLAKNDSVSDVRGEALIALGTLFGKQIEPSIFQSSLEDRSYLVVASALDALAEVNMSLALEEAQKLQSLKDDGVIFTIARLYANDSDPRHSDYFNTQLDRLNGFAKYPIIVSYQDYLMGQRGESLMTGINRLAALSKSESSWFMRMAAVNGLLQIKAQTDENGQAVRKTITASDEPAEVAALRKEEQELIKLSEKLQDVLSEIAENESNARVKSRIQQELN